MELKTEGIEPSQEQVIEPLLNTPTLENQRVIPSDTPAPILITPTLVMSHSSCIPAQPAYSLKTGDYETYPQSILDYLNSGRSQKELDESLYQAGVANQPVSVAEADMSGDGKSDIAVSIFNPASPTVPPGGSLIVYTCEAGKYILAYQQASQPGAGAPGIRYFQDLNADGRAELVSSSTTCGAHTCFETVEILAWDGEQINNVIDGSSNDLPNPIVDIQDSNRSGIYDLAVTGSGIGSVGAGPQRNVKRTWVYIPALGRWQARGDELSPSNYRIHVLQDAERAERKGNFPEALLYYQRVITDSTLQDWVDPAVEQLNISAYARYKMYVIYLMQGQADFAQTVLKELESNYPSGSSQRAFVEMAITFQRSFVKEGQKAGCSNAIEYARQYPAQILDVLGPRAFGYANPDMQPEDVCPW